LALPLIALQYHEVRLDFEFEDINKLMVWSGSSAPSSDAFSMKDASIFVDYIYLDAEERRRFAQVGHEYLIEQVQFTGEESLNDGSSGTIINGKFKLGFNHPCKELIWALKLGAYNGEGTGNASGNHSRFLTYTDNDLLWETSALDYAAENLARGMIALTEPTATGIVAEEITLDPSATQVVHTSTALPGLTVTINYPADLTSTTLNVWLITNPLVNGTYNLGAFLGAFTVTLSFNSTFDEVTGYTADVVSHSLSLVDVSVPIEDWTDNRSTTASSGINPYDCTVVQFSNYGVNLDGSGNPMLEGNIQLNGHDRFDIMEGAYFNYVQPYHHHTRTPADGINVYSFSLHPEQHQPSGTANLSRIDNTLLVIRFSDPLRANKSIPKLNLSRDSLFYVYAVNYNVLRIMSGMGGLAYSN